MKTNKWCFCYLQNKRWIKMPILWKHFFITEILWQTFWRNIWQSVFDVVKILCYCVKEDHNCLWMIPSPSVLNFSNQWIAHPKKSRCIILQVHALLTWLQNELKCKWVATARNTQFLPLICQGFFLFIITYGCFFSFLYQIDSIIRWKHFLQLQSAQKSVTQNAAEK